MIDIRVYGTFTNVEVRKSNLTKDIKIEFFDEHKNDIAIWLTTNGCKELIKQLNAIINEQTNEQ
jgi:hypothetical protein